MASGQILEHQRDAEAFEHLSRILLETDRQDREGLRLEIEALKAKVDDPEAFSKMVVPIIAEQIEVLRKSFPEMFGPVITESIKVQIANSQDEVVTALYPIMGKLIQRYIRSEIDKLRNDINSAFDSVFSFKNIKLWMRSKFTGASMSDLLLSGVLEGNLEKMMVVQKESGKLIAEYPEGSADDDLDVVASMLSVIKNFMEDAFKKNQDVETIEYDDSRLIIHSELNFFVVAVMNGNIDGKTVKEVKKRMSAYSGDNLDALNAEDAQKYYSENCRELEKMISSLKKIKQNSNGESQ